MTFRTGDTVTIPMGTLVFEGPGGDYIDQAERGETKRASKVKIIDVNNWSHFWFKFIDGAGQKRISEVVARQSRAVWWSIFDRSFLPWETITITPELQSLIDELKAETDAIFGDYVFLSWGNDLKHCLLSKAEEAEAPKIKPPKEAVITKRRQMVVGSIWRFTQEVEIEKWIDNPEIDMLCRERDSYHVNPNSQHMRGSTMVVVLGGGRQQTAAENTKMTEIQERINALPRQIKVHSNTIPKGVRIKITDKLAGAGYLYNNRQSNGLNVPCEVIEGEIWTSSLVHYERGLPYTQIEAFVEAETIPEELSYVLRDRQTGEYYAGWQTERAGHGYNRQTNDVKMSKTFSGSKKFKTKSACKAGIMDFTGYHNGIQIDSYVGDWVGGETKKMDLPSTWEMVEIDKTTNAEKSIIDVQDWFANLMRLRTITAKVNSGVRGIFKKIEGKPEYPVIVSFDFTNWDDHEPDEKLPEKQTRFIKEALDGVEDNKPPSFKTPSVIAYAIKSQMDATMIVLGYQGAARVTAYETTNLEEMVINKDAVCS